MSLSGGLSGWLGGWVGREESVGREREGEGPLAPAGIVHPL